MRVQYSIYFMDTLRDSIWFSCIHSTVGLKLVNKIIRQWKLPSSARMYIKLTRHCNAHFPDITSYRDVLTKWNFNVAHMFNQCQALPDHCLTVKYEDLVLHPRSTLKRIVKFRVWMILISRDHWWWSKSDHISIIFWFWFRRRLWSYLWLILI